MLLCEISEIEHEVEESETTTAKIIECKCKVDDSLKGSSATPPLIPSATETLARTHLPKLVLPKFKGDVTKWTGFWESFDSAVNQNRDISKVDKFNNLHSLLEGTAASVIQGLTLSEANYDTAIELLKGRFGKPQTIICAHMDELLKVPACTNDRSASLRSVYDRINVHIRGLSTLGIKSEQYGSLLIPVIMTKLPDNIQLRIARETKSDVWKLDDLMKVIRDEVEAREASEGTKVTQGQPKPPLHTYKPSRELPSAATLLSNEFRLRCAYCDGPHFSASCSIVNSVWERRNILLRSGKCFNCLKSNHKVKDCHSRHTCHTCHKRHHQSICDLLVDKLSIPVIQQDSSTNQSNKAPVSNTTDTTSLNVTTSRSKGTILLQTAQVMAVNPVTGKHQKIRILFDNGSQRSYITESLCSSLNLQAENNKQLQLNTFGDKNHRIKNCSVFQLEIRGVCTPNRTGITALSFPVICTTLPSVTHTDTLPHLEGLELADNSTGLCDRIDILVGSDFYWDFVSGDIRTRDEVPIAVNSSLGWLLSGPVESTAVANLASSHMIVVEPLTLLSLQMMK